MVGDWSLCNARYNGERFNHTRQNPTGKVSNSDIFVFNKLLLFTLIGIMPDV